MESWDTAEGKSVISFRFLSTSWELPWLWEGLLSKGCRKQGSCGLIQAIGATQSHEHTPAAAFAGSRFLDKDVFLSLPHVRTKAIPSQINFLIAHSQTKHFYLSSWKIIHHRVEWVACLHWPALTVLLTLRYTIRTALKSTGCTVGLSISNVGRLLSLKIWLLICHCFPWVQHQPINKEKE